MSEIVNKLKQKFDSRDVDSLPFPIEELNKFEEKLREEYNSITSEYRILFKQIGTEINKSIEHKRRTCSHNYIRECEYHNDRYFICDKCGHEKY